MNVGLRVDFGGKRLANCDFVPPRGLDNRQRSRTIESETRHRFLDSLKSRRLGLSANRNPLTATVNGAELDRVFSTEMNEEPDLNSIKSMPLSIISVPWPSPDASFVRLEVFNKEIGFPADEEFDEHDPLSDHVVAYLEPSKEPIGTGRLDSRGKLGRVAVISRARGLGIGTAIVRRLLDVATERDYKKIYLHSISDRCGFYEQFGFAREGEDFDEVGVPHRKMVRYL